MSAFEQIANRELAAWQIAGNAAVDLARATREKGRLIAEASHKFRTDHEAQVATLVHGDAQGVSVLSGEPWRQACDAAHQRFEQAASAEVDMPRVKAALEEALAAWDRALMALAQEPAHDVQALAHLLSRLAASEQDAVPDELKPEGLLPVRPGTYRAWLRGPGGFEGVHRHIRASLIKVTGLEPGAQKVA